MVVCFDQLWRTREGGAASGRIYKEEVHRFYSAARVQYVKPAFARLPVVDYITFWLSLGREKKMVTRFRPDIIVGFTSILSCYWGLGLSRKLGVPFVFYWTDVIHSLIPSNHLKGIGYLLEQHITRLADSVVVINDSLRDYILQFEVDASKIEVIPGGVDLSRYSPSVNAGRDVRLTYNIDDNDLVLFFMGWIYEFSGLHEAAREMASARERLSGIKMLIVGEGDGFSSLRALVKELRIEECFVFTGQRPFDEIPNLISAADICVLPAIDNETMKHIVPIKMYEYLAMGKPVIASRLIGLVKEFGDNNGVIYIDGPEQLIDRALSLSSTEIQRASTQAGNFIADYDWIHIAARFKRHLQSEIDRRRQ